MLSATRSVVFPSARERLSFQSGSRPSKAQNRRFPGRMSKRIKSSSARTPANWIYMNSHPSDSVQISSPRKAKTTSPAENGCMDPLITKFPLPRETRDIRWEDNTVFARMASGFPSCTKQETDSPVSTPGILNLQMLLSAIPITSLSMPTIPLFLEKSKGISNLFK